MSKNYVFNKTIEQGQGQAQAPGTPKSNPFGQRRHETSGGGSRQSYSDWKKNGPNKVDTPLNMDSLEEFPTLGSLKLPATAPKPSVSGVSLAERLKITIATEATMLPSSRLREEKMSQNEVITMKLSSLTAKRIQQKREEQERKRREVEEDEKNYEWQMSKEIGSADVYAEHEDLEEEYPPYAAITPPYPETAGEKNEKDEKEEKDDDNN